METFWRKAYKLLVLKLRFALSGLAATSVDYGLYLLLVDRFFPPVLSNVISYSCAVVANFLLQKRFVFRLQGPARQAFLEAMAVSAGGLALSTAIVYGLSQSPFFDQRQYLTKLVATGVTFFYNFYFKRYVFERRFFGVD